KCVKPPHLAINDEVSKEAVSQLRIFSMQKFRPKGRGFTPSEIFCIISKLELSLFLRLNIFFPHVLKFS
ncbi:MAG TPA: hypothetical protein VJH68_00590, partial [Candidatus Nanoarchaeia archaeon]|nr:hypothetical protein [Candidatus Nanoarchaeia archaeon]